MTFGVLGPYALDNYENDPHTEFRYHSCTSYHSALSIHQEDSTTILTRIPLSLYAQYLTLSQAKVVAKLHGMLVHSRASLATVCQNLCNHTCSKHCCNYVTVFKVASTSTTRSRKWVQEHKDKLTSVRSNADKQDIRLNVQNKDTNKKEQFPPRAFNKNLMLTIITNFCNDTCPSTFEEAGCAVCGRLVPKRDLTELQAITCNMDPLKRDGVARLERKGKHQVWCFDQGPILDSDCQHICRDCLRHLRKKSCPPMALANGLWLGKVPEELKGLTFVEKMIVARIRHSRCIVRVASGRYKLRANAISFQNPMPKIYEILPPPIAELDQVLACIFTGPCIPTEKDIQRTPLLVRRNKIGVAIKWLILNHVDYQHMELSTNNLNEYPIEGTPVTIDYRESIVNKDKESVSIHDNEDEEGTEEGDCPFVVHGITGDQFSTMSMETIKAKALQHLMTNGKIMFIGHSAEPESIYKNPQLFPSMMPWLFPYGLGGIGNEVHIGRLSSIAHKRHLLMYHDKRFQTDPGFALIALNHDQIQSSTTGGYLTADKAYFHQVVDRLYNIDLKVLSDITLRLQQNVRVKPESEAEKACYKLLNDLDVVGGHVKGSITSKKYMRNEIWSLISSHGAPSWFITVSPADNKHPISLYFAGTDKEFKPDIKLPDEAYRLVASNPVAAARFFDFVCKAFIKNVLGVGQKHPGAYGQTSAYYGTVEQQGRLTLHLHMLVWLRDSLSPQSIRDNLLDKSSDFQKQMVEYMESAHQGEFYTGELAEVSKQVKEAQARDPHYKDPTKVMPEPPPFECKTKVCEPGCEQCFKLEGWWDKFRSTVDDLLLRSNIHSCRSSTKDKNGMDIKKGCVNKQGKCKARFPREVNEHTMIDNLSGALKIKKREPWLNTFTPVITYLLRCNSDATSLLSGTAIKAIVAYVSDYVTKPGLKTYTMFETIRNIFDKNSTLINSSTDRQSTARSLMTKMVNALTAKMEIGSPMASLYLLGNPDHYTGHVFVNFYWKNFVHHVESVWLPSTESIESTRIVLNKNKGKYVGLSSVQDYMYRPHIYREMCLYDWIKHSAKSKRSKKQQEAFNNVIESNEEEAPDKDNLIDAKGEIPYEPPVTCGNDAGHAFLRSHPQFQTHHVRCTEAVNTVPDFIGGTLPRRDQGEREYYCMTMLTLFQPWRTGKELKTLNVTWDESFNSYKFTANQLRLMDNFNLRYECNDARDDYSAKLKVNDNIGSDFASWATRGLLNELDTNMDDNYFDDDNADTPLDDSIYLDPCSKHLESLNKMRAIEQVVQNAGWLDDCAGNVARIDTERFVAELALSGRQWMDMVKAAKDTVIAERTKHLPANQTSIATRYEPNQVVVDNISYLNINYKAATAGLQKSIDDTSTDFQLNKEQQRAFRIVANHAATAQVGQLKMYLGGMGGTGKSQVIKALMSFFALRNESHRILILAPTGSAAALLLGSTYHSVLGILPSINGESSRNEHSMLAQVKTRLQGVDYIFIDEISMVACHDLYKISSQQARARSLEDLPFGGINMIFAGDFAQLPPVGGQPLFSGSVGTAVDASQSTRGQQSAIGKALWHQVTTVVILRQNMRQNTQSVNDAKLRTALENMRYAACTTEDIEFLRTRIAGKRPEQPKLTDKYFRNVSIITALNVQKDKINQLGCERFAKDTGQTLTHFYSVDKFGEEQDPASGKKRMKKKRQLNNGEIDPALRDILWNLRHSASDHIPGKLSLCMGLPVVIRNNEATELCITKGQEGYVAGWQSAIGPYGQLILDTLFVKLDKPAKIIQLEGLPENVVPLAMISSSALCVTPSGIAIKIKRSQVPVLPNFAMTDYASQGKTRPANIVDLSNCRDHMSYYTCLSRGATCEGTIILQGFSSDKITRGTSGYLRQEFRELEILDEITRLRYEQKIPKSINSDLRNGLIYQFQLLKGSQFVPINVPSQLRWTESDPMIPSESNNSPWMIVGDTKKKKTLSINQTVNSKNNVTKQNFAKTNDTASGETREKRKAIEDVNNTAPLRNTKKSKFSHTTETIYPIGLIWDGKDFSCAYDALLSIMFNMWSQHPLYWSKLFSRWSEPLDRLVYYFGQASKGQIALEEARDKVRGILHSTDGKLFPYGQVGTSIDDLASKLFGGPRNPGNTPMRCKTCDNEMNQTCTMLYLTDHSFDDTNSWYQNWQKNGQSTCAKCNAKQPSIDIHTIQPPDMLLICIEGSGTAISKTLKINIKNKSVRLHLKGVVYLGDFHFTCKIVFDDKIWFHDGIETKRSCRLEGNITEINKDMLMKHNGHNAVSAIYTLHK